MSDERDYSAPSPADGPTTPASPGVPRPATTEPSEGVPSEPETVPAAPAPTAPAPTTPTAPAPTAPRRTGLRPARGTGPGRTRLSGTWVGFILGAVVLVFLLVFILQNLEPAQVAFLGWRATLPLGIWLLFAAVAGVLLLAVPGLGRMLQWRRATGRSGRMER